jgi:hypothetical protein
MKTIQLRLQPSIWPAKCRWGTDQSFGPRIRHHNGLIIVNYDVRADFRIVSHHKRLAIGHDLTGKRGTNFTENATFTTTRVVRH